jgi:hypothetical protein
MPTVTGNADQVRVGPGKLWVAPWTSNNTVPPTFPTTIAGALNVAFKEVGFTTEGNELTYSQTSDGVEVAERLRPIKQVITAVEMSFEFTMAQLNPTNLALATNAPASSIVTTASEVTFKWPKQGGTQRVGIVWEADDGLERLVLAKCFAGGDISIPRRKGADPAAVGVTFTVEENPAGEDAYLIWGISLVP